MQKNLNKELIVYNISSRAPFSMDPRDSDILSNLIIMDQVVGTLVKYGHSGRYEPYLAEKWSTSADKLIWDFTLRNGLVTEDGVAINANNFVKSLLTNLKNLYISSEHTAFDYIEGLEKIKEGNFENVGIKVISEYQIKFIFKKTPQGLIEYLAQPYYGFYTHNNFNNRGEWKDSKKIISSGHYILKEWKHDGEIILEKRKGWFSNLLNSPEIVHIKTYEKTADIKETSSNMMMVNIRNSDQVPVGFKEVLGTPEYLTSFILSPFTHGLFFDIKNREQFKRNLRSFKELNFINDIDANRVDYFYKLGTKKTNHQLIPFSNYSKPLKVVLTNHGDEKLKNEIKKLITNIISNDSIVIEYDNPDIKDSKTLEEIHANKSYDIRVATVNAGSFYENWAVQMMFCGTLGVSFVDNKGEICQLTRELENSDLSVDEAVVKFEDLVESGSTLIPIYRTGYKTFYSENIKIDGQSPTVTVVRFDLTSIE